MLNGAGNYNNTIATAPVTPGNKTIVSLSSSVSKSQIGLENGINSNMLTAADALKTKQLEGLKGYLI
jgi:hypothetical protein